MTAKDLSRIHQFGEKVLPGLFLGYALYAGGIWKGDALVADLEGVGDDGRIGNLLEKTQCERGDISHRKRRIYFSNRRWTGQNSWRRSGTENIHLDTAATSSRKRSPTYPELLIRIWMSSKKSLSMITGISMAPETCQILGQVSHNLLYWKKNLQKDICGPGGD